MGSPTATTTVEESVVSVRKENKKGGCFLADLALRVLLLAATVASVVVMVTSKETKLIPVPVPGVGIVPVPLDAKFSNSPAFIYLVAAMAAIALYSIITTLASFIAACKPACSAATLVAFAYFDVLALGIAASATGAAGGVAYIGLKGNSHTNWSKICSTYDGFCKHAGASIALSLAASIILSILLHLSIFTFYSKIRRTNC